MSDSHVTDRLEVEAETRNLAVVREFLHAAIKRSVLPNGDANKVVLAVDEAVANTIQHGYEGMERGNVEVLIDADDQSFRVRIRDNGVSYDTASGSAEKAELDLQAHIASGNSIPGWYLSLTWLWLIEFTTSGSLAHMATSEPPSASTIPMPVPHDPLPITATFLINPAPSHRTSSLSRP